MSVNFDHDLLLLTAASGKICRHLLPVVTQKWKRVRLICNSQSSKTRLRGAYPNAEVLALDLLDRTHCQIALRGVAVCLYIGPSFHPHEAQMGMNMVDAAVAASGTRADGRSASGRLAGVPYGRGDRGGGGGSGGGVGLFKHFVFSSVLNTQLRKLAHHDGKRYVEEYLLESGLNYTLAQPAHFMQNFPPLRTLQQQQQQGAVPRYQAAYSLDVPFSFLDLADYAAALARILAERDRHYFAQYSLCSTAPMSGADRLRLVGEVIGAEVGVELVPLARATDAFCEDLFGDAEDLHVRSRDAAERMLAYYDRHGLVGSPVILELLLGRKPTTMREWAERDLLER